MSARPGLVLSVDERSRSIRRARTRTENIAISRDVTDGQEPALWVAARVEPGRRPSSRIETYANAGPPLGFVLEAVLPVGVLDSDGEAASPANVGPSQPGRQEHNAVLRTVSPAPCGSRPLQTRPSCSVSIGKVGGLCFRSVMARRLAGARAAVSMVAWRSGRVPGDSPRLTSAAATW